MSEVVLVSLISLGGTLLGTFGGIVTSNRLTMYRIEQLEKKVEEHNNMIKRTFVLEEKMKLANYRLDDLEKE